MGAVDTGLKQWVDSSEVTRTLSFIFPRWAVATTALGEVAGDGGATLGTIPLDALEWRIGGRNVRAGDYVMFGQAGAAFTTGTNLCYQNQAANAKPTNTNFNNILAPPPISQKSGASITSVLGFRSTLVAITQTGANAKWAGAPNTNTKKLAASVGFCYVPEGANYGANTAAAFTPGKLTGSFFTATAAFNTNINAVASRKGDTGAGTATMAVHFNGKCDGTVKKFAATDTDQTDSTHVGFTNANLIGNAAFGFTVGDNVVFSMGCPATAVGNIHLFRSGQKADLDITATEAGIGGLTYSKTWPAVKFTISAAQATAAAKGNRLAISAGTIGATDNGIGAYSLAAAVANSGVVLALGTSAKFLSHAIADGATAGWFSYNNVADTQTTPKNFASSQGLTLWVVGGTVSSNEDCYNNVLPFISAAIGTDDDGAHVATLAQTQRNMYKSCSTTTGECTLVGFNTINVGKAWFAYADNAVIAESARAANIQVEAGREGEYTWCYAPGFDAPAQKTAYKFKVYAAMYTFPKKYAQHATGGSAYSAGLSINGGDAAIKYQYSDTNCKNNKNTGTNTADPTNNVALLTCTGCAAGTTVDGAALTDSQNGNAANYNVPFKSAKAMQLCVTASPTDAGIVQTVGTGSQASLESIAAGTYAKIIKPLAFVKGRATKITIADEYMKGDEVHFMPGNTCTGTPTVSVTSIDTHKTTKRQGNTTVTFAAAGANANNNNKVCLLRKGAGQTAAGDTTDTYRVVEVTKIVTTPLTGGAKTDIRNYFTTAEADMFFEATHLATGALNTGDAIMFFPDTAGKAADLIKAGTKPTAANGAESRVLVTAGATATTGTGTTADPYKTLKVNKKDDDSALLTIASGALQLYVSLAKGNDNDGASYSVWHATGLKTRKISVAGAFPSEIIKSVASTFYLAPGTKGLKSSDAMFAGPNCATASYAADSAAAAKKIVTGVTIGGTTETANTAGTDWNSDSALTVTFTIPDNTWAEATYKLCYCGGSSTDCATSTDANIPKFFSDAGVSITTRNIGAAADTSATYTEPKKALGGTDFYVREANKTTFALKTGDNAFPIQTGFKFAVIANGKTCGASSAIAGDAVADATITGITLTGYQKASWDITVTKAQTANNAPYVLCFQFSEGAYKSAGALYVSNPGTTVTPNYMLSGKNGGDKTFTLTGSGFTAKDAWCWGVGTLCPATCNSAVTPAAGTTPTTATFKVTRTTAEAKAGTKTTICYRAGGVDLGGVGDSYSLAHNLGVGIDFVTFDVKPQNVLKTGTGKTRNYYICNAKNWDTNDKVAFGTDCTATTLAYGAANATSAFGTAGAQNTCWKRGSNAAIKYETTANSGARIITVTAGNAASDFVSANAATYYLVSDVNDHISFTGTIQAGDNLRVLAKSKSCTTHAAADAVATSPFTGSCTLTTTWKLKPSADDHPLCIKVTDGVDITATTNTEKYIALQTAAVVKVATVTGFTPTTLLGNTWEKVTFTGNHIDTDDFASFVATYYSDCTKAWVYEQALTSSKDAYFKLPGGKYALCFLHRKASAHASGRPGYKYHTDSLLHPLTVKSIKSIMPAYTSGGKSGDYTLMLNNPWMATSDSALTGKDRVVLTAAATCDKATTADGFKNVTVADGVFSVKAVTLAAGTDGASKSYKLCVDFENSLSYNAPGVTGFASTHDTKLTVTAYGRPTVVGITPTKVVMNTTNTVTFWGGYLGADKVHFLANSTCTNASITAIGQPVALASGAATTLHATEIKTDSTNLPKTGRYEICYQYSVTQPFQAESGKNPAKSSDISSYLYVVNVDSISPTNAQQATAPTATDATGTITITFKGYFGVSASDWAAFVPATEKDCSKVTAWSDLPRAVTAVDANSGTAKFNLTDNAAGGEWKLCYKFSGLTSWTWYGKHIFASRIINSISPTSALRKGAGSTTVTITGSGQRVNDEVFFIFANTTTKTDAACADAVTAKTEKSKQNVTGSAGMITFTPSLDGVAGGVTNYWICYKYGGQTTYDLEQIKLVVESAKINNYYITGKKGATDALVVKDPTQSNNFTFEGTGVGSVDTARFIPTANATSDANCAVGTAGIVGTSEYKIADYKNIWTIAVGATEFVENTKYTLCYKFGSAAYARIMTDNEAKKLEVDVKVAKKVDGGFPLRFAAADASTTITIVGSGISTADAAVWVKAAADCTDKVAGTPINPTAPAADGRSATLAASTLVAGQNYLCYKSDGGSYSVALKVYVGSCNATNCKAGEVFCANDCGCYAATAFAASCADPAAACAKTGQAYCAGTGTCRRSIGACPPVTGKCPPEMPVRCPGQECAKDLTMCVIPAPCPVKTHIRCEDGSCARISDGCNFRGSKITLDCGTGTKCELGYCSADNKCTPYNGCPWNKQFQGADCRCYATDADAKAASSKCVDGSAAPADIRECKCSSLALIRGGGAKLASGNRVRRFVVRATAATKLSLYNTLNADELAVVDFPAAFTAGTCTVGYMAVPNSVVYNFEGTSADSKIYSVATGISINGASGAACVIDNEPSVEFKATSVPTGTAATDVECKNLGPAGATLTANHDTTGTSPVYRCKISASAALALGKGVAQSPVGPPGTNPNNTGTGSPGTGTSPSPGAASTVSVSMLVAVFVAFVGALMF
eukprot:TRINITY_DN165_c0_g1_i1.p1 TRINITY_DN165_c0_g1~~TRINITY_DN165_c0_g1_i1.p1  ORF type:complete len:2876 (+),score=1140.69 TRINITY_DN165_c0_g1_i1:726-8630(+)